MPLLRHMHPVPMPSPMPYDLPLWHNVLFRNVHNQAYFCPRLIMLITDGIVTWGGFLEDDSLRDCVVPTRKPIYNVSAPPMVDGDLELDLWKKIHPWQNHMHYRTPPKNGAKWTWLPHPCCLRLPVRAEKGVKTTYFHCNYYYFDMHSAVHSPSLPWSVLNSCP